MMQFGDELIGEIVAEVETKGIMNNTVIVFLSDNGGATGGKGRGQNLPLRGRKSGKFEGGIRTASFMYGGFVDGYIGGDTMCDYNDLFYVSDWFPSLMQMASNNSWSNEEIREVVMAYNDSVDIDGIGL